jgi:hypothetical protein
MFATASKMAMVAQLPMCAQSDPNATKAPLPALSTYRT